MSMAGNYKTDLLSIVGLPPPAGGHPYIAGPAIAYGNGRIVIVAGDYEAPTFAISQDGGKTWDSHTLPPNYYYWYGRSSSLTFDGELFVLTGGHQADYQLALMTSPDGQTWTIRPYDKVDSAWYFAAPGLLRQFPDYYGNNPDVRAFDGFWLGIASRVVGHIEEKEFTPFVSFDRGASWIKAPPKPGAWSRPSYQDLRGHVLEDPVCIPLGMDFVLVSFSVREPWGEDLVARTPPILHVNKRTKHLQWMEPWSLPGDVIETSSLFFPDRANGELVLASGHRVRADGSTYLDSSFAAHTQGGQPPHAAALIRDARTHGADLLMQIGFGPSEPVLATFLLDAEHGLRGIDGAQVSYPDGNVSWESRPNSPGVGVMLGMSSGIDGNSPFDALIALDDGWLQLIRITLAESGAPAVAVLRTSRIVQDGFWTNKVGVYET